MKKRSILVSALIWAIALTASAQNLICDICGELILNTGYSCTDEVTGEQKKLCATCAALETRCFACGLPVKTGFLKLADGRYLCARDAQDAVQSESQAKDICSSVKDDLDRLLSRFLTMPADNSVEISIVDKFHLENLFHAPGYQSACVSVFAATASNPLPGGKYLHTVDILSCLSKSRLMAVCAHEYMHAWMGENVRSARTAALDRNTLEAFCELVSYKYMESRKEDAEMALIKRNTYTKGQIDVLLAADARFGFNAILDWIKDGDDTTLTMATLDRVRSVSGGAPVAEPPATPTFAFRSAAPTPVPDTLLLKGISGAGQHKFALINNATFETMERGKVRVGQTNVSVQCLEIRNASVVIAVNGSSEKQELFLQDK